LLAKFSERPEHEGTPLARQGRLLGRQGRVTRGAILGDAKIDRRSPAGRLPAVLGLVRDDPQQPGTEWRTGTEAREREIGLGEAVLRGILGFGREAGYDVRRPRGECLVAPHQLAVCLGVSVLRAFHEYSVLRRPALHGVGSHPSYNHLAKRFPAHAETRDSSSRTRLSIALRSARSIPSTLKSSTAKEAHTVPCRTARQSVGSSSVPARARCPSIPPANASPAPVGARTCSSIRPWISGRMLARKTNSLSAKAAGTAGSQSPNTPRSVLMVSAVARSWSYLPSHRKDRPFACSTPARSIPFARRRSRS